MQLRSLRFITILITILSSCMAYGTMSELQELAATVQHFAYLSHDLVTRISKHQSDNGSFSKKHLHIISTVQHSYQPMIDTVRSHLFSEDLQQQKMAITEFGNYILSLCNECNVRTNYFLKLPATLDTQAPIANQIALITKAVTLLEHLFMTITPEISLRRRLAKLFLYNFISTKVVPPFISFGIGPALTGAWGLSNLAQFTKWTDNHPHENPLYAYQPIQHKEFVDFTYTPSLLMQALFGIQPIQMTGVACRQSGSGNICNAPHHDAATKLCKKFKIERPKLTAYLDTYFKKDIPKDEKYYYRNAPTKVLNYILSRTPDKFCAEFKIDKKDLTTFISNIVRAPACPDKKREEPCYQYRGLQSPLHLVRTVAWSLRPLSFVVACYLFSQWLKEAQLPEYAYAIKQKEKQREADIIATEMRHMKVNYETSIGFAQIKGLQEVIENEMKMIVDYLKYPLRYKNSASGTRSILLYGPPGTGKTILARAIAKESGAPFFELTADDILDNDAKEKIIAKLRLAAKTAAQRREKSAMIYIDEIDSITGNRQDGILDPQRAKALANLLTIFDGIEKGNPFIHIVIIMATNHYKKLDPALLRPGRIDRKIAIMPPNAQGRREFFEGLLPEQHKHLIDWFITQTDGYTGAQIVHIIDMAQMMASFAGHVTPTEQDYKAALQKYKTEYEMTLTLAQA